MRRTRSSTSAVTAALLAGSLAACSGGGPDVEQDPEAALEEAVGALADYDGIELVLGIDGDRDAIAATDDDLDETQIDLILDSTVVIRAAGDSEEDAQAEVLVDLAGERAFELRFLPEQQLFVRLDLDAVGRAVDDPSLVEQLDDATSAAEEFGLADLAGAVRAGEWVQLTGIEQLTEFAGGASGDTDGASEEPTEEEVEDVRERLVAALQRFLERDVDVTYVGEDEVGERVTATTTQAALASLTEELSTIASDLSGVDGDQLGLDDAAPEGGDEPVEVDLWIDDGRLSQVGFDLGAVADDGESAPEGTFIVARIAEFDGSVGAPEESTEIDLFAIFGSLFGGGLPGLDGAAPGDGALGDGAADDAAPDDGAAEGPLGGGCIPQAQLDELTGGDEAAEAEIQEAIDAGLIEVC
jgi:hypothetical protein